jgi:hypothetical protein
MSEVNPTFIEVMEIINAAGSKTELGWTHDRLAGWHNVGGCWGYLEKERGLWAVITIELLSGWAVVMWEHEAVCWDFVAQGLTLEEAKAVGLVSYRMKL